MRLSLRRIALFLAVLLILADGAIAEVKTARTRHFDVRTDIPIELATPLLKRMDLLYDDYARWLGASLSPMACELLLVSREADFRRITGIKDGYVPPAIYSARKRAIVCLVVDRPVTALVGALQHEMGHCIVHQLGGEQVPAWFNEGLADYFEQGLIADDRLVMGEIGPQRAEDVQFAVQAQKLMPIDRFVLLSQEQWRSNSAEDSLYRGGLWYLQAWGEMAYLLSDIDADGLPARRRGVAGMLEQLRSGKAPKEAFEQSFGMTYSQMDDGFRKWARTIKPTTVATCYDTTTRLGSLLLMLHQNRVPVKDADDLYREGRRFPSRSRPAGPTIGIWVSRSVDQCFTRPDGKRFTDADLRLESRDGVPIPDIVYSCFSQSQLRARFRYVENKLTCDVVYESGSRPTTQVAARQVSLTH